VDTQAYRQHGDIMSLFLFQNKESRLIIFQFSGHLYYLGFHAGATDLLISRPVLGPTQHLVKWVLGSVGPWVKRQAVKLNTDVHVSPRTITVELYLYSHLRGVVLN
jgi:hypothetical protein